MSAAGRALAPFHATGVPLAVTIGAPFHEATGAPFHAASGALGATRALPRVWTTDNASVAASAPAMAATVVRTATSDDVGSVLPVAPSTSVPSRRSRGTRPNSRDRQYEVSNDVDACARRSGR